MRVESAQIANIVRRLFRVLTGQDMPVTSSSELADRMAEAQESASATAAQIQTTQAAVAAPADASAGFDLSYDHYESYRESESLS